MKLFLTALLISATVIGCDSKPKFVDCNREITEDHVGFMIHGGILDKYDNGRVFVSIVHIANPYDWDFNEYFTGTGFSKDKGQELKIIDKDSCDLKQKYFEYLDQKPKP